MRSQTVDLNFNFFMMNFEITFSGVRAWLEMAGHSMTDIELFQLLLSPEQLTESDESEILRTLIYRYEDVFFQANRLSMNEDVDVPVTDTDEPLHQLLLRILQYKTLNGEQNALIELYLLLQNDKISDAPLYPSLHDYFELH
ncbi:hypothetical protein ABEW19_29760 [Paenibacillus illinoisensis]|uniref:hypothetical protein n=1 Tax=Paenibacillus illinoisensis TaxID=59845 RepID=UPI003D277E69